MSSSSTEYNVLAGTGIKPLARGTEYREWRLAVIDILAEKGYWDHVSKEGSLKSSDTTINEKAAKARGLLGRLMDSNHRELYATERDPHMVWTKLESRYSGKDQARIWYLRGELSEVRYNNEPMVDYIAKLEKLFNQLAGAGEKQSEKDKLYVLLANLPIQYHPFRTAITNSPNFENIKYDDTCDRLILEHQQLIGDSGKPLGGTSGTSRAFLSRGTGGWRGRGRGRRLPNFLQPGDKGRSGASGSPVDRIFEKNRTQRIDKDSCLNCHERGHWAKDCPKKPHGGSKAANEAKGKLAGAWTAATSEKANHDDWILDSGATHHMSSRRQLFQNLKPHSATISIANGGTINATGIGEIFITVWNGQEDGTPIRLREVLYVPGLGPNNLVLVRCIQQTGAMVLFGGSKENQVSITTNGKEIAVGKLQRNSYLLAAKARPPGVTMTANTVRHSRTSGSLMEWHERLGHLGFDDIKRLASTTMDIEITGSTTNPTCEHCHAGKQTRKPNAAPATHRASEPLELIHSDLAGPMSTNSLGGARYFLLFIDDFSRYTTVYTIKQKSEVIIHFQHFKAKWENQLSLRIKRFRSDGGGEYSSKAFTQLLDDSGIVREQTAPYSPEQNGVSERANRTIIGRAKAMIFAAGLTDEMWGEAVHAAVYLKNRVPTSALAKGMTPLEVFTGERPTLADLIPFGAKGFKHVPKELRTKWEPNSVPCIFTGYGGTTQYRVMVNRRIHITRDFDMARRPEIGGGKLLPERVVPITIDDDSSDENTTSAAHQEEPPPPTPEPPQDPIPATIPQTPQRMQTPGEFPRDSPLDMIHVRPPEPKPQEEVYSQRPKRANAGKFTSTRFHDEEFSSLAIHNPTVSSSEYHAYSMTNSAEPTTYTEAVSGPDKEMWEEAKEEELTSLRDNHTWVITTLPPGRTVIRCKWVFREKKGAEGETIRYKARLVAKGFTQKYGVDYLETYAPVVKLGSLRILLAIAACYDYEIHQGDIKTAYLLGRLEEEIYLEIPEGVKVPMKEGSSGKLVCRLLRGLYRLKQSGRIWNKAWDNFLVEKCHFTRSSEDHGVYYHIGPQHTPLWTLIWVDDILWIGTAEAIKEAKRELGQQFPLKDLGAAHFFLGMRIIRKSHERKIILLQDQYIDTVLKRFGFENSYPVSTPMEPGSQLFIPDHSEAPEDYTVYRSILGSVMYLMLCTRPDLAYAVGALSKYSAKPTASHMKAVQRVLRYISKTRNYGLHFGPFNNETQPIPTVFSDADWAGDRETRRSTGAYICTLSDHKSNSPHTAITWASKQQSTIALSSTEAEYMALTQACKEALWVKRFVREIADISGQAKITSPITIFADN